MITAFAIICCAILIALTVFQISLIAGAPLGKYAWGGSHTVLPARLRIGSVVSILIYGIIALVVLSKTELVTVFTNQTITDTSMWIIAIYFCLGIVMNAVSRSKLERNVMTPIVTILAIICLVIAAS